MTAYFYLAIAAYRGAVSISPSWLAIRKTMHSGIDI